MSAAGPSPESPSWDSRAFLRPLRDRLFSSKEVHEARKGWSRLYLIHINYCHYSKPIGSVKCCSLEQEWDCIFWIKGSISVTNQSSRTIADESVGQERLYGY